jgi:SNF2 family DNA or RNA helicase
MQESFKEEKQIEIMEVPSSEDEEDEVDDQDAYMDEDAKEASTVLAAANELSASVLRIMTSWASDLNEGGDNEGAKMTVPQGMIVDGALAMASLKKNPCEANNKSGNNSSSHSWISNEVMQHVLPNLTLAEYQLIGVNWMAMLHKMTYTVTKGKATNVNGILADEMGRCRRFGSCLLASMR